MRSHTLNQKYLKPLRNIITLAGKEKRKKKDKERHRDQDKGKDKDKGLDKEDHRKKSCQELRK